ncbi:hypothetical protein VTJ83DRAFT_909 [Remersonia thermophila]|uniref:Uncharacterized protein n=1 Tax=Remersonia thermophila TaxID=72144 RepID=A0ABR4DMJ4_9PEZI
MSMDRNTRTNPPSPPALNLGPVRAPSNPDNETPRSAGSTTSSSSHFPVFSLPASSPTSSSPPTSTPVAWSRQDSNASTLVPETTALPTRRPPTVPQRKINAHSYCGRHSDEFLLSGWKELWREVTSKKGGNNR